MMVFLHDASLYLLYAALGLAVYLAIERTIFYAHAHRQIKSLLDALKTKSALP
jgi:biopolymer transport protein ExbB